MFSKEIIPSNQGWQQASADAASSEAEAVRSVEHKGPT